MGELRDVVSPGLSQLYWKVLRSGGAQDLGEFESADGLLAFAIKAFALPDDCVGVAIEDVAERRRGELALRASEAMRAALLDAIPDLTVRFRKDGEILDARDGRESLGFLRGSRLVGSNGFELAPHGVVETMKGHVQAALGSGSVQTYEYAVPVDGRTRHREVRIAPSGPDEVVAIVRDITERRDAEKELHQSEERFRLLAENAQDIIFRLRLIEPIGFDYVSPAMATLTGYSPEECYRDPNFAATIVHPDDQAAYRRMVWERQTARIELRWVCKDSSVIWIEQRSTPVCDSSGRPTAVEGVVRNITDRVRAEETLRESEERFRLLAENAQDMIFRYRIAEPRGFEYVSPAVTAIAGYAPEQYYADPDFPSKIIHPDDRDKLDKMARELHLGPVELRWICNDGSTIWTEQRNTLIYDESGNLVAAEGIVRDVTNRKAADQALRASEERHRLLAERAQDVIYRYHIAPYRSFDYISPSISELLGYTPEECYADPDLSRRLVHKEDEPLVRHLILGGQSPVITVRGLRKDGTVVWTEQRNIPIYDESGALIAVEGIARDVSERVRAEEKIQVAREELETKVEQQLQRSNHYGLTFRELTVLNLVADGKADKEIAAELGISPLTVHKHLTNILSKMNAASRTEAGVRALREGLVT